MDHFTLSASKNVKEWSTDIGGYGNLAIEFMQTPECHAAVDAWTALVKSHQRMEFFFQLNFFRFS